MGIITVELTSCGSDKLKVVMAIKNITGLGVSESKDLADKCPSKITSTDSIDYANACVEKLRKAGGVAELTMPVIEIQDTDEGF